MTVAIKVENLSKKHIIRHEKQTGSYKTFSNTQIQGSKNIASRIRHPFSSLKLELATKTGLKQDIEQGEWNAKETMIINAHQLDLSMQIISKLTGVDNDKIIAVIHKIT